MPWSFLSTGNPGGFTLSTSGNPGGGMIFNAPVTPEFIGPDIVTSGLILYLDAANPSSYPGTGTNWNSLVNTVSASFTSSVIASSENLGSLTFDGSTQYADFNLSSSGSILTIEMWAKLQGLPNGGHFGKMFFGWDIYDVITGATGLGFNTGDGDLYGITSKQAFGNNILNNWHHYVFEMAGSSTYTSNKIWIDGVQQTLAQQTGTQRTDRISFNAGRGRIAGWRYATGQEMPMSCSMFNIYNRALSAGEISQNYNAVKSRYPASVDESIVTSGLVLNLDAGKSSSYGTSGTTWTDISENGNNVTLTNGPTYNALNAGSLVFDGTNDYADFFAPNLGTTTTVEMWVKLGAAYSGKILFGWDIYDVYASTTGVSGFGYNTGNGDIYGFNVATITSLGLIGNWKHYVFEMRSDVAYTNNKIYVNGVSQTLSQQGGSEAVSSRNFNSGLGRISGWRRDTNYPMPMNCGVFRVYNRALTTNEISQNYNAMRYRYGV